MKWNRGCLVASLLALAGCASHASRPTAGPAVAARAEGAPVCLADAIPSGVDMHTSWAESLGPEEARYADCHQSGTPEPCERACESDVPAACYWLAIHHQAAGRVEEENAYFRKACILGYGVACTNFGAGLVHREAESEEATARNAVCGTRIFERTCAAGEAMWGCGMYGMSLARGTGVAPSPERARAVLEKACREAGGFACAVLGSEIDRGRIAAHSADEAAEWMRRACETGYDGACER